MPIELPTFANEDASVANAIATLKIERDRLLAYPNVIGVSVGLQSTGGKLTGRVSIKARVKRKLTLKVLDPAAVLPRALAGCPVDVVEAPTPRANAAASGTLEPWPILEGGIAISLCQRGRVGNTVQVGTLAAIAYDTKSWQEVLLTNWHVACLKRRCIQDETVCQPYRNDEADHTVGNVHRWIREPYGDAAIVRPTGHRFAQQRVREAGWVRSSADAYLGMRLRKFGAMADSEGFVSDVSWTGYINVSGVDLYFVDQIAILGPPPIAVDGDSGALWIDAANRAVGVHCASYDMEAFSTPVTTVMEHLRIDFEKGLGQHDCLSINHVLL